VLNENWHCPSRPQAERSQIETALASRIGPSSGGPPFSTHSMVRTPLDWRTPTVHEV